MKRKSPTVPMKRVPVTVLTGFLGSGKTTLLNHILRDESHGMKFAVIENEFGEIGIDQRILSENVHDSVNMSVIETMNGCICCKVGDDLVAALKRLYEKVETFDGVIIETTGLADPAPVVQTFFAETNHEFDDEEVLERMYKLDGIITVTDAKYILERLDDVKPEDDTVNEAEQQVCFADKILLNKTDLVTDEAHLDRIEARLTSLNPTAPILRCQHSHVAPKELLDIGAFDLERVLEFDPFFLGEFKQPKHDKSVTSISTRVQGEVNMALLDSWIKRLLQDYGHNLYRYKGIIAVKGFDQKYIFQGVGDLFTGTYGGQWEDTADSRKYYGTRSGSNSTSTNTTSRESTFVFIGKNLDTAMLRAGFEACREMYELRFPIGTMVEVFVDGAFQMGMIMKHWDSGCAYHVQIYHSMGDVFVPVDIIEYVRALAAPAAAPLVMDMFGMPASPY